MSARLSPPRAVVFDLDGTLVNSMPMVMRAFAHALQPFRPDMTEQELFGRLGGPPLRMFQDTLGDEAKAEQVFGLAWRPDGQRLLLGRIDIELRNGVPAAIEGAAIVDLPELQGSAKLRGAGLRVFTLISFDGH